MTQLGPFCPSSLLADCLEVAITARTVDMRASPYDLSSLPALYPGYVYYDVVSYLF
jgi:hypothetical protein